MEAIHGSVGESDHELIKKVLRGERKVEFEPTTIIIIATSTTRATTTALRVLSGCASTVISSCFLTLSKNHPLAKICATMPFLLSWRFVIFQSAPNL